MLGSLAASLDGLPAWQVTALVVTTSLLAALVLEFVVLRFARRFVAGTETTFDNVLIEELRLPLVITTALAGVYLLTQLPAVTEAVLFTPEDLSTFFGKPSLSVILLVWAFALNRVVNRVVEGMNQQGSRFDFAPVFSNVWTLVVLVGTVAAILSLWEISVEPLLGAAGIAGIAVGFAAKDTVANFFGGIALYFDDTYKIGDFVVLDSGEKGTVVSVGVRSTTLMTRDEVLVTVPNSVLNAAKIVNQSAPQHRKRVRVPIGVGYGTDIDEFEALIIDIAHEESLVLDSPKPRMRFRRFGDSALEYELLCWVRSPTQEARATHNLNRAVYKALDATGIEIPFPKRDVTVEYAERSPSTRHVAPESVTDGGSIEANERRAVDDRPDS
ncbi:mechanosensitive ion channel family protein [Haloprofundus salinisoli]|uniref:mechanosensitive ion channel family protein n=1 Tax=Haloprofundus salinisoli TaxID=2876193 RepID=UPI001CCBADBD|nr:mechanosensitive ion channel family protein [Haloprofundus salinisoli]